MRADYVWTRFDVFFFSGFIMGDAPRPRVLFQGRCLLVIARGRGMAHLFQFLLCRVHSAAATILNASYPAIDGGHICGE